MSALCEVTAARAILAPMNVFERYLTVWVFICILVGIAAGQLFELAVAAAISLFGFESGAALTTVVGVLIEVPVMLLVVGVVNSSKGWYERQAA